MAKPSSAFPKAIYLGACTRTPIGKFGGSLKHLSAPQLAGICLQEARSRVSEVSSVDFVIMGHARQAGCGPNPARQASVNAGLDQSTPAITVNQACASGLAAIINAAEKIACNKASSIWAGGVESMSNTPYLAMNARWGQRLGHSQLIDGMNQDGFFCPIAGQVMGATVEDNLVPEFKISRSAQDEFALQSQQKATDAQNNNLFDTEICKIPDTKKIPGLKIDEHVRPQSTLEKLVKLPAVFNPDSGTISAGNASGITDGAAFVHVSDKKQSHHTLELVDYECVALDPKLMGLGPVAATQNLLKRHNLSVKDLDAVELNEAFAAQVLACQATLKIPENKLNIRGGSIALGHPIGATGTRIIVTLAHILAGKTGALGLATLCVSGGQGVTVLVKVI